MPRKKKTTKEEKKEEKKEPVVEEPSEKDQLLALYEELKRRNIRSISDLENQIASA